MYVVSGITGHTGRVVARELRAKGHEVRAVVRNPKHVAALEAKGFEVRVADLGDEERLAAALQGARGAYLLVPPHQDSPIRAHQEKVASSIAQALQEAHLDRAVLLSSIGAERPSGTGPIVTCHVLERECEGIPNLTFLRAAYFLENWLAVAEPVERNGVLPSFLPDSPFPMVATADIGKTAASLLVQPEGPPRVVQLAGPQDLTPGQVATAWGRVIDKEVRVIALPPGQAREEFSKMGVADELSAEFAELYQAAHDGRLRFDHDLVLRGTTRFERLLTSSSLKQPTDQKERI